MICDEVVKCFRRDGNLSYREFVEILVNNDKPVEGQNQEANNEQASPEETLHEIALIRSRSYERSLPLDGEHEHDGQDDGRGDVMDADMMDLDLAPPPLMRQPSLNLVHPKGEAQLEALQIAFTSQEAADEAYDDSLDEQEELRVKQALEVGEKLHIIIVRNNGRNVAWHGSWKRTRETGCKKVAATLKSPTA